MRSGEGLVSDFSRASPPNVAIQVHAGPDFYDLLDRRVWKAMLGPVVDEPAAIEPAQSIGCTKPEETPRIGNGAAYAIVREAIRRVVDLDCQTFSLNVD